MSSLKEHYKFTELREAVNHSVRHEFSKFWKSTQFCPPIHTFRKAYIWLYGTNLPAAVEERSCQDDDEPIFPRLPPLSGSRVVELARTPVPLFALFRLSSPAPTANVPPSSLLVSSGRSSMRPDINDDADVGCCSRNSKSSTESDADCLSLLPVHRLMSSQPRVRDRVVDDSDDDCTAVDPFNTGSSWLGNAV